MLLNRLLALVLTGFFCNACVRCRHPGTGCGVPAAGRQDADQPEPYLRRQGCHGGQHRQQVRLHPQYEGLEALNHRFGSRGFTVLGFPSNDFQGQEPGSEKQIQEFCTLTYGVKFPMFEKVHVLGAEATPLYQRLTQATGVAPGWNFHKYLIGRDGRVVAQFPSKIKPDDPSVLAAIERELKAPAR